MRSACRERGPAPRAVPARPSGPPAIAALCAALLALAAGACHGSGVGRGNAPPVITVAALSGGGLSLFLSEDVLLLPGALLTDEDVALSGGATLGNVTTAPVQVSPRLVRVTLGAGAQLTTGTTTIALSSGNDAVADASAVLGRDGDPQVIQAGDGTTPALTAITLNTIDSTLNGTGPAGGMLQVPNSGFTIDLSFQDPTSAIDHARTVIVASRDVSAGGAVRPAGENLLPYLTPATLAATSSSHLAPPSVVLPDGVVTLTAYVGDVTGMMSAPASFMFLVRPLSDAVRPFETTVNGTQIWFLHTSRDVESFTHTANVVQPIAVTAGSNGRSDLEDLFLILGLHGSQAAINAGVTAAFRAETKLQLDALYAGANVSFTFDLLPDPFPSQIQVPYASFYYSQISIAGAESATGTSGILGAALFDKHNVHQDDDTLLTFQNVQRLGVFLHTIVNVGFRPPSSTLFRTTYDPLAPFNGGTPIGAAADGLDANRVAGSTVDARATTIHNAIRRFARFTAVVVAHECGHSLGLVADGAMPNGLYGGDAANFPGSTTGHIVNSNFPPGSVNVMSPALGFDQALSSSTAFNPLNRAYLRERVVHN